MAAFRAPTVMSSTACRCTCNRRSTTRSSFIFVETEPEERPKVGGAAAAHGEAAEEEVVFPMAWTDDDELCPEGTVPVRQTTKRDALNNPEQVLRRMEQERRLVRMGTAGSVSIHVLTSGGGGEAVSFLFNGASMASSGAAVAGRTTLRARAPPWGKTTNAAVEGG
uniref:Neprosin activation peptide domain-containing protein n=1 Tax=Oryza barthii TaxID=65489 RepID=A0A0D3HQ79_9ORYZ